MPNLEQAIKEWLDQGPWFTVGPALIMYNKYLGNRQRPEAILGFCQVRGAQLELMNPLDEEPSGYRRKHTYAATW